MSLENLFGNLALDETLRDLFKRTMKFEPMVGEEIRRDETLTDDYHGLATDNAAPNAPVWSVVRFYKSTGKVYRVRFRTGMAWDDRTVGW